MRRRHQAALTAAVVLIGAADIGVNIPADVTPRAVAATHAPLPARPDDSRLLRHAQLRATRAEHRRALARDRARSLARARRLAELRREHAASVARARELAAATASSSAWAHTRKAIGVANCESGPGPNEPRYDRYVGDPHLADPNGHYGKWQFAPATADSVGAPGAGIAQLPEAEQDYYAWKLWLRDGWGQWQCAGEV